MLSAISLNLSAQAEEGFPIKYTNEIKPKNYSVSLFYLDSFDLSGKSPSAEFRGEVRANFLNDNTGIISEISFQHTPAINPAIISGILPKLDNAHTHDAGALIGYRFGITENIGISPFLRARGIVTRGKGGDNLYGAELGGEFNWSIYPETANFDIRYGLTIPILHNYTGSADIVSPISILLSTVQARLSYRVLENINISVGYQIKSFPKNLGNSNLATTNTLFWQSVLLGAGFVF